MPIPYRTLSDHTLNLLAESGDTQALMELGYRAERLGILAELQELVKRLREDSTQAPSTQNRLPKTASR